MNTGNMTVYMADRRDKLKSRMILIVLLIVSLLFNIVLLIKDRNETNDIRKVWNLSVKNASFLYQQYEDMNVTEAYDFAAGEIAAINNTITFIDYGGRQGLTDSQKGELSSFYQNLIYRSDLMKLHISEIRQIIELLQQEDNDAFLKMQELRVLIDPEIK